jgi:hypothetical protein
MKKKPLIGFIPTARDTRVASVRLRCALPCRYLVEAGWDSEIFDPARSEGYDLLVFQKAYTEDDLALADRARTRGTRLVFDLCDNHFYVPADQPQLAERADRLKRMIEAVGVVSVSTAALAELVPGKETVLIDDALDGFAVGRLSGLLGRARLRLVGPTRGARIVWYGNAGSRAPSFGLVHLRNVIPLLEELQNKAPFTLTVISNSRAMFESVLQDASFPSRYVEWNYRTFPAIFRAQDLCIIPIEVNPFTYYKTGNRVALSLSMGVPVVADRIPSFDEFSEFIIMSDWEKGLLGYARDERRRADDARRGKDYVLSTYTKARVVRQWSEVFERALG